DATRRCIVEAAALNAAHVEIALVHEGFDEKGERLAVGPERGISANVGPERLHELETTTNVGNNLWEYSGATSCKHAQSHIRAWPHYLHEFLKGEVGSDGLVSIPGILEKRKGIAQRRAFTDGEEEIFREAGLLFDQFEDFWHAQFAGMVLLTMSITVSGVANL